jgi:hypothetical protein
MKLRQTAKGGLDFEQEETEIRFLVSGFSGRSRRISLVQNAPV